MFKTKLIATVLASAFYAAGASAALALLPVDGLWLAV